MLFCFIANCCCSNLIKLSFLSKKSKENSVCPILKILILFSSANFVTNCKWSGFWITKLIRLVSLSYQFLTLLAVKNCTNFSLLSTTI
ncbi:hypothetical protein SPE_0725 [Spiroplasma eriocheiris CCTCC M 207170]|nr:hypothetical protein SPE_0725 [Spiroplasma eriocheiris CCTCC M 207170]